MYAGPGTTLKNLLRIVTFSACLSGCASLQLSGPQLADPRDPVSSGAMAFSTSIEAPQSNAAAPISTQLTTQLTTQITTQNTAPITADSATEMAEDPLPSLALTKELLFNLLSAEIAFQRGQWQAAYITTFSAAQQTRDARIARRAAEMAVAAKQNTEALAAIRLWYELAPHSEEATQYLIGAIVMSDEITSAQPMLAQRLADARPITRGLMLLQMQRMLSRAPNKAASFALLERLVEPYPEVAESHIALAQGALSIDDPVRALREAQQAMRLNPDSELGVLTLAQVVAENDAVDRILRDFIKAHPTAREVRLAHARLQIDQKKFAQARSEFEALLALYPDDLTSLYALGVLGSQSNDVKNAEKYLTLYLETLANHPDDERDPSQALLLLAQIAEERKDISAALDWLAQIEGGTNYVSVQIRRAQLSARQGNLDTALRYLNETHSEVEAEQIQLILAQAMLLRDAGRVLEASASLQSGLQKFPAQPDLLYELAMLAEKSANYTLMESTLRTLIQVAPNNQHAYNALGYSLAERNLRLPEALSLIETALKITPNDPFILDSLGWVQYRLGHLKEAEVALRRAYTMRSDPEIAVHLGEVLWVAGQKEDAYRLWHEAKGKDPQNDVLKSTLARLHAEL